MRITLLSLLVLVPGLALAQDPEARKVRPAEDDASGVRLEAGFGGSFDLGPLFEDDEGRIAAYVLAPSFRLGLDLDNRLTPLLGLGFTRVATSFDDGEGDPETESATALLVQLELRYYLAEHRARRTQPYVFGRYEHSLVFLGDDDAEGDDLDEEEDQLDRWGVGAGFGAEYLLAEGFGLGGRFGLAFTRRAVSREADPVFEIPERTSSLTTWQTLGEVYGAWRF